MNNLEFINREIDTLVAEITLRVAKKEQWEMQNAWHSVAYEQSVINMLKERLQTLHHIKDELKAWKIVKNSKIQIKETFVDKNGDDNIVINLIFKEKDFGKFEKALEVE